MGIFIPTHGYSLGLLIVILGLLLGLGYLVQRGWFPFPRVSGWLLALFAPAVLFVGTHGEKPGFLMLALILSLLLGMKGVVAVWAKRTSALTLGQWLAFSTGWLGMRPQVFLRLGESSAPGYERLLRKGAFFFSLGLVLFVLAKTSWVYVFLPHTNVLSLMLVLGFLLPALSLILHFGLLTLLAGFWRWRGVPVGVLFNAPMKSGSLKEFWGYRWNIAFAEMTAIAVYRPMRRKWGDGAGRVGSFIFSGLAHELAISVPVNAGYGLPTIYFLIQAIGAWFEKRFRMSGRLWTMLWILLPAPILFHTPFITEIIIPLMEN